ncbi:MAG: SDR family NAD(P)-dependent oxidoreductase, partial [Gemmataceae bacterium]
SANALPCGSRLNNRAEGIFLGCGPRAGKLAVLFPGQGAQYPGMLRELACQFPALHDTLSQACQPQAQARDLIDRIYPLILFSADERRANEEALRSTDIAQPALGAVSLGAWRILEQFGVRADAAAGHSYGELTALCAAGRLKPEAFFSLSHLRGRLMAEASGTQGAMLAVQSAVEIIRDVLRTENIDLVLANKNSPQQTVLSGPAAVIERAAAAFASRRIHAQLLAVSAAFHSPLVASASEPFRDALEDIEFQRGTMPVFANSTAEAYPDDAVAARDLLAGQLARPVEFVREIERLHESGIHTFLEVGPGHRLTGLVSAILQRREHQALALDSSNGQRSGVYDLACCLAELAVRGHEIKLAAWDADAPPLESQADSPKRTLLVPLCGANYVKPKSKRVDAASEVASTPREQPALGARTQPRSPSANHKTSNPTMNGSNSQAVECKPVSPSADNHALTQALQLTRDTLTSLQRMQDQTAQLHRQFLDGQDAAQRTVQLLVEQQQRLLQASLGLPIGLAPPPTPVVSQPAVPISPLPHSLPVKPLDAPAAIAPPPAPPQPATAAPAPPVVSNQRIEQILLEVIAEKTGYPTEMLELDMALDADLGIDSIKRVEILSALQERLPEAPVIKPEHLGTLHNLRDIAAFLANATRSVEDVRSHAERGNEKQTPFVERSILRAVPLANLSDRQAIRLQLGATIWIASEDEVLSAALDQRLRTLGYRPRCVGVADLRRMERPAALGALVILAHRQPEDEAFLKQALFGLQHAGPALRSAGQQGGALFVTVSRLDGGFGLLDLDAGRDPLDGGLAGLAKTAGHEWPDVHCKAIDLADDFPDAAAAAAAIVEEMFRCGPTEVGLAHGQQRTLECVVQPLTAGSATPFQSGDALVLSGGARGVTAEVAVALARAFRPTLLLLGRIVEPTPEPEWLAALSSESDIKRELGNRANGNASLKQIGEQYRLVSAQREIRQTLARIEAAGARALYRAVDIRDAAAVKGILTTLCQQIKAPVRGIIHGAGVLADARIEDKTVEQFERVYATKVAGLQALLRAVDLDELRALVLFSSSTARFGRTGQVDYAIANEVLNKLAQQLSRRLPRCRVVSVNWGPWDGGMVGPELKKVFEQEGIGLIPLAAGADYLIEELRSPPGDPVEVVLLSLPRSAWERDSGGGAVGVSAAGLRAHSGSRGASGAGIAHLGWPARAADGADSRMAGTWRLAPKSRPVVPRLQRPAHPPRCHPRRRYGPGLACCRRQSGQA